MEIDSGPEGTRWRVSSSRFFKGSVNVERYRPMTIEIDEAKDKWTKEKKWVESEDVKAEISANWKRERKVGEDYTMESLILAQDER